MHYAYDKNGVVESPNAITLTTQYDYEEVLERIGFGKTQWVLLLISGLLTITSMAAQISFGIIAVASKCEFEMTQVDKGIMLSSTVTGIFLSTYVWGYVSDAVGRRMVLLYSSFIACVLEFITMFVTNIWLFNIINLITGISVGGITAAVYPYLSEFNVAKYRAIMINYATMFVSVSAIYVPAMSWWILSGNWSYQIMGNFVFRPWRLIILFNFMPALIGALMLLCFPESPKLLLAQQKQQAALDAIEWICKFNTGRGVASILERNDFTMKMEDLKEQDPLSIGRACGVLVNIWKATVPLVHKPHGAHFIMSSIAVFCLFFSTSGMQFWYPEIVNRLASGVAANDSTVCEILDASFANEYTTINEIAKENICVPRISTKTYVDNIIMGCAFLVGFILQGMLLNPLGRKNVVMGSLTIAIVSGFLVHFVKNPIAVLVVFCLYMLMPGVSISVMCGALVELVPTQLRGKAVSIAFTLGRFGIVVAANLIGFMLQPLCNTTFAIFKVSLLACMVLVHFLPI